MINRNIAFVLKFTDGETEVNLNFLCIFDLCEN
jgi:hypothetical protein